MSVRSKAAPSSRGLRPPRALVYIEAVARHGSIRKAAEALNVASSALNRQILDLERDLGSALFERLPRGVRLTSAGEVFLAYSRDALSDLSVVQSRIEQLRGLVRGKVRIAAVESVAGELLPGAITEFQREHQLVQFNVQIGAPAQLITALVADEVDLILTHHAPARREVSIVGRTPQTLCAIVGADHPLAARRSVHLRDCIAYPLALADASLAGRALIEEALAHASFNLEPRLVSNSVETMRAFARMNNGVCFQFGPRGKAITPSGDMVALPLSDPALLSASLILAARRGRVLPLAAASFLEVLKAAIA